MQERQHTCQIRTYYQTFFLRNNKQHKQTTRDLGSCLGLGKSSNKFFREDTQALQKGEKNTYDAGFGKTFLSSREITAVFRG